MNKLPCGKENAAVILNIKYVLLQSFYWALNCFALPFAGMFLLGFGYSNGEIGVILALGYVLGMLLQPVTASIADRTKKLSAAGFIELLCFSHIFLSLMLTRFEVRSFFLSAVFVLFFALQIDLQPHINSFAMYIEQAGTPIRFGVARGCGSLFWGLGSLLLGWLTDRYGAGVMLLCCTAADILLIAVLFSLRHSTEKRITGEKGSLSYGFLAKQPRYLIFMAGIVLIFCGYTYIDNFPYQIVSSVGGDSIQMGQIMGYIALIELPAMFSFEFFRKKYGSGRLLVFSAVFAVVKDGLVWLSCTVPQLYFALFFHLFSYAVMVPASVRFTDECFDAADATRAQALLTMAITLGSILSSYTGGIMIDRFSPKGTLFAGAIETVIGAALVIWAVKGRNKGYSN